MEKENTFEASLHRLEEIVRAMEGGDLSLDESIRLFQEGIDCSKQCTQQLKTAELRILELKTDKNGEVKLQEVSEDAL